MAWSRTKSALVCVVSICLFPADGFCSPGSTQHETSTEVVSRQIVVGSQPHSFKSAGKNHLTSVDGDVDGESALSPEDMTVFQSVSQYATERNLQSEAIGDSIQSLAEYFLGLPYRGYQLDQSDRELLSVNLQTFDCVIFVETMLALARSFAVQDYSVQSFLEGMQTQRYRNGEIDGYCSRLHYFTDWIGENERQGRIRNITAQLGGISIERQLDFMTSHREAYPQLVDNDENYRCIAEMETALSPTELTYIPTAEIREIYSELRAGDIVAIATSISGLDVSHTSFIHISEDGNVGVIHSDIYGVKIEPDLQQFLESAPNAIGAIIARPNSLS